MIEIRKILIPTDFSENSKAAIQSGCELARKFGAEVHLLNVVDNIGPFVVGMEMAPVSSFAYDVIAAEAAAVEQLAKLPGTAGNGYRIIRSTQLGPSSSGIKQYAMEKNIDLIVICTHGYTGWEHLLMGSVAEDVVRRAPCPVLTVHPTGHQVVVADSASAASLS